MTTAANLDQSKVSQGEPGEANVRIRCAKVQLELTKRDLSWISIYAPTDRYVTNMDLLTSTFVSPGTPFLFRRCFLFPRGRLFPRNHTKHIQPDDRAIITQMRHHEHRIDGETESIGYAINPPNLSDTEGPENLISTIEPTLEWICLAQRVPVRNRFKKIPEGLHLVAGITVSNAIQK